MSSLTVPSSDEYILPSLANVKFSRVALKQGGQKSAQVCLKFLSILKKIIFFL